MRLIVIFRKNEIYIFSQNSAGCFHFFLPHIVYCIQDRINDFLKGLFLSEISSEKSSVLTKEPELFQSRPC